MLTSLFWKPFDARFQEMLEKLSFHYELVRLELQISQFEDFQKQAENTSTIEGQIEDTKSRLQKAEKKLEEILTLSRTILEVSDKEKMGKSHPEKRNEFSPDQVLFWSDETSQRPQFAALAKCKHVQAISKGTFHSFKHPPHLDFLSLHSFEAQLHTDIKTWLYPPDFATLLEQAQTFWEEGTGEWLYQTQIFNDWLTLQEERAPSHFSTTFRENMIWIRGTMHTPILSTGVLTGDR